MKGDTNKQNANIRFITAASRDFMTRSTRAFQKFDILLDDLNEKPIEGYSPIIASIY